MTGQSTLPDPSRVHIELSADVVKTGRLAAATKIGAARHRNTRQESLVSFEYQPRTKIREA